MYATIRRYERTNSSTDALAIVGSHLGSALTRTPGFIATVAVEDRHGALITFSLFEDQASLVAAEPIAARWTTEHRETLGASADDVVIGEVVAQKGL